MADQITITLTGPQANVVANVLALVTNDPDWWGPNSMFTMAEARAADNALQRINEAKRNGRD